MVHAAFQHCTGLNIRVFYRPISGGWQVRVHGWKCVTWYLLEDDCIAHDSRFQGKTTKSLKKPFICKNRLTLLFENIWWFSCKTWGGEFGLVSLGVRQPDRLSPLGTAAGDHHPLCPGSSRLWEISLLGTSRAGKQQRAAPSPGSCPAARHANFTYPFGILKSLHNGVFWSCKISN